MKKDFYEILGVSKSADGAEIKKPTAKKQLNSILTKILVTL